MMKRKYKMNVLDEDLKELRDKEKKIKSVLGK